jgi:hypothetical protein
VSLSFVQELQAQVERLEKEVLEAEAAGKDRPVPRYYGVNTTKLIYET